MGGKKNKSNRHCGVCRTLTRNHVRPYGPGKCQSANIPDSSSETNSMDHTHIPSGVLPSASGNSQATVLQDSKLATTEASEYFNNPIHMLSSSNNSTEQNRDPFIMQVLENLKRQTSSLLLKVDSVLNQVASQSSRPALTRGGTIKHMLHLPINTLSIVCATSRVTQHAASHHPP